MSAVDEALVARVVEGKIGACFGALGQYTGTRLDWCYAHEAQWPEEDTWCIAMGDAVDVGMAVAKAVAR